MTEQIKNLLAYQQADLAVDSAEKAVKGSAERKKATVMKQRYELAVEERKKLLGRKEKIEKELTAITSDVEKLTGLAAIDRAQDVPEDNEAIQKLLTDIDKLLNSLRKLENQLKDIHVAVETDEKKINEYAAVANKAREEFNINKEAYEKLLDAAKPEIDACKAEREKLKGAVEPTLLHKYMALKKNKIVPTAPIQDSRCGGCHMEMPSFTVSNAVKNGYCECENCGRIVYIE